MIPEYVDSWAEAGGLAGARAAARAGPQEPQVDRATWEVELERIAPRLRTRGPVASKEWRSHLEQTARHRGVLGGLLDPTSSGLEKVRTSDGHDMRMLW